MANVLALATFAVLLLVLLVFLAWCVRIGRRLRLLEAARRSQLETLAVPQFIDDREMLEITVPRFIGCPHPPGQPPRKRSL
jgi:hypothetical protein